MASPTVSPDHNQRIATHALWWLGPAAAIIATAANVLTSRIAIELLGFPAEFFPLSMGPTVVFTVAGVLGATVIFAIVGRFARRPIRLFLMISAGVMLLVFMLDIGLLVMNLPGTTLGSMVTLILMQVLTAGIGVSVLTTMARE